MVNGRIAVNRVYIKWDDIQEQTSVWSSRGLELEMNEKHITGR